MLAEWSEFEHLVQSPAEWGMVAGGEERLYGQPALVDFSSSLLSEKQVYNSGVSPVKRRSNFIRLLKGRIFGTVSISARNSKKFRRFLFEAANTKPFVLMVGAATQGAGTDILYEDDNIRQIAFDIYATPQTHFIADAHHIPLKDKSVDAVWIQAVLEHVLDPSQVVAEITRVLKPNGLIYVETPFMQQVHEGAYDFTRFSELGHRWLLRDFEAIDRGALGGPGLSLYWAIQYFLRGLTRSRFLGNLLSLPFLFISLMDCLIPESHRVDGANGVYFLGIFKGECVEVKNIVMSYIGSQK